jgi:hypothetical protein
LSKSRREALAESHVKGTVINLKVLQALFALGGHGLSDVGVFRLECVHCFPL